MVEEHGGRPDSLTVPRDRRLAFWVSFGGVSVALAIIGAVGVASAFAGPSAPTGARSIGYLAGLLVSPLVVYLVMLPFVWGMYRRMASAAREFPQAFRVPIVVGYATARSSATLARIFGSSSIRLRTNTYATFAIDSLGVHVFKWSGRSPGLIPIVAVTVGGFAETPIGSTSGVAIVLQVRAGGVQVELPIIPMRLRGNALRRLQQAELESARARIINAISGGSDMPSWPF